MILWFPKVGSEDQHHIHAYIFLFIYIKTSDVKRVAYYPCTRFLHSHFSNIAQKLEENVVWNISEKVFERWVNFFVWFAEMGVPPNDGKMEGWLFIIRSHRFGLQFSRRRYFILQENYLRCYKTMPISQEEVTSCFVCFCCVSSFEILINSQC